MVENSFDHSEGPQNQKETFGKHTYVFATMLCKNKFSTTGIIFIFHESLFIKPQRGTLFLLELQEGLNILTAMISVHKKLISR